ncbi:MAG TPA: hypothetical protein VGF77_00850 [Allosphingosinicella sp.]
MSVRFILAGLMLPFALSACATAQMHPPEELSAVGRACGAAEGEVIQDAEEKRILFLYAVHPPQAEVHCLALWARRHHLHLAYVDAVNFQGQ